MNALLISPKESYESLWLDLIQEYNSLNETFVPNAITGEKSDYREYLNYLQEAGTRQDQNHVPSSTYFLMTDKEDRIYGVITIRHFLTEKLKLFGGHVGYGIRPSERGNGLGKKVLLLGLEKCMDLKINSVRVTCDKSNVRSARVIINAGGKLVQEYNNGTEIVQVYDIFIN
ncbi:MAG: GNAT family N-acetyltransferase [Deltaproteobacteria bacterium]|jgi:predicted acetyltransferase|nr:GNAT family N-acetyltransferase [Deltaproteobacteria bacterium]